MERMRHGIQLSRRLQAVAELAGSSGCLADIGTDHAFLPVYLVEQGLAEWAIALDVNRGPLQRAEAHIREHGLAERIETRLSDGGAALQPGEADTMVIAGMGGPLTLRILQNRPEVFLQAKKLVLQPQSEIAEVRRRLPELGYRIVRENMVEEDGKYYPMMLVIPGAQNGIANGKYLAEGESQMSQAPGRNEDPECAGGEHPCEREILESQAPEVKPGCVSGEYLYGRENLESQAPEAKPGCVSEEHPNEEDVWRSRIPWTEIEYAYGKYLIESGSPVLREFLIREERVCGQVLESLKQAQGDRAAERKAEILKRLDRIRETQSRMAEVENVKRSERSV